METTTKEQNQKRQYQQKVKRPFKRRTLNIIPCSVCGIPTECVNKTKTLKCWNCRMKMIKDYQHEHRALKIYTNYAEPITNMPQ